MTASKQRKFWGLVLAIGGIASAIIGSIRLFGKEKQSNFFGPDGSVTFNVRNNSSSEKSVSIFSQTAVLPGEVTVTGGDLGFFTRSIGLNPAKLKSIAIKSNNLDQLDVPFNLTYKDMGGDIVSKSFTPAQSEMQEKDNIARVDFKNAILDGSAQLDYVLAPNANVSFTVSYEKTKER